MKNKKFLNDIDISLKNKEGFIFEFVLNLL